MKKPLLLAASVGLIICSCLAAFGLPVGDSLRLISKGAFGDWFAISRSLVMASPLILTALGAVIAWKAGMFNIGGEGQYVMGGLTAAVIAPHLSGFPFWAQTIVLTLACGLGGAAYALLAGWLFVKRQVEVVISTILLNFVALQILSWAVSGPLQRQKADLPQTENLAREVMFARPDPQADFHIGIFMGVALAVLTWAMLSRTKFGFRLKVVGANAMAARSSGIPVSRIRLTAMALSGFCCGLAAASEYIGVAGTIDKGFSQNWAFLGIPTALLGGLHPLGALVSAVFFGGLFAGSENLARFTSGASTLILVMQSAALFVVIALQSSRAKKFTEAKSST